MRRVSILMGVAVALLVCASPASAQSQTGFATWYSQSMPGTRMTCGVYNPSALTAATERLRCGTKVRVTRVDDNRSVVVTVDDHASLVAGEVIQLSQAAMDRLDGLDDGVVQVRLSWGR